MSLNLLKLRLLAYLDIARSLRTAPSQPVVTLPRTESELPIKESEKPTETSSVALVVTDEFDKIEIALKSLGFTFKRDVKHLFCLYNREATAIFQKNSVSGRVSLHIRASATPNHAAALACAVFACTTAVKIGDNFEFTGAGDWLFGDKALKEAAQHMEYLWFGKKAKEISDAVIEAKDLDKATFN